jgi:hypothetical protein
MSSDLIIITTIVAANILSFGLGLGIGKVIWGRTRRHK